MMTECANCCCTGPCYDDGEAYVCINGLACMLRGVRSRIAELTDPTGRGAKESALYYVEVVEKALECRKDWR